MGRFDNLSLQKTPLKTTFRINFPNPMKQTIKLLSCFAALAALCTTGHAQITQWTGATNGVWSTATNWSNGVAGQDALFSSAGLNQAITLTANVASPRALYLYGGNYSISPIAAQTFTFANGGGISQLGAGTFTFNPNAIAVGLTFNGTGTGAITLNGTINNGAGAWDKFNESAVNLTNAYTTTNATATALRIRSGALTLSGLGSITQGAAAEITIGFPATYQAGVFHNNTSAALVLDNAGTNNTNRITDTNRINFNTRGLLDFRGNAGAASSETFGILNASGPGTMIRVSNGAGQSSQLTFASLLVGGTAVTADTNGNPTIMQFLVPTGSTLGAAGASGSRILFTAAPSLNNGVLRYGVIKDESTNGGATFATYNTTVDNGVALGVQALAAYTTTDINASVATSNVDISGGATLSAARTANAIRITPTASGQSLDLSTFALNLSNTGGAAGFIFNGGFDYAINNASGTGVTQNTVASYLYINSNTLTINAPYVKSSEMTKAGDGALVISGGFNNVSTRHLGVDDGAAADDMTINGVISGSNLVKAGLGTLVLGGSGDNGAFGAGVNINAGTVILDKSSGNLQNNALGSGVIAWQGGTLSARNTAATFTNTVNLGSVGSAQSGNQITGNAAITFSGLVQGSATSQQVYPIVNNAGATFTLSGTVQAFNANPGGSTTSTIEFSGSGTTNVTGVIQNGFANGITAIAKSGSGLLTLSGPNTYTGLTQVNAGYLRLDSAGALGGGNLAIIQSNFAGGLNAVVELGTGNTAFTRAIGTAAGQVNLGGSSSNNINNGGFASVTGTSTVNLNGGGAVTWGSTGFFQAGGALQLGSPNVAGTVDFQNGINLAGNRTITALNGSAAIDGQVSGVIADGSGSRVLTKNGAGGLALTNANTYTGGTIVSEGTLLINNASGSGTGTGAVTVASGAALGGGNAAGTEGFISGAVTVNGSLRPGNSIGTLTVTNDVTWNAGNAFVFELGTAAATQALANTGSSTQDMLNLTGAGNDFLKGTGTTFTFDFANTGALGFYKLVDWTSVAASGFANTDFAATNLNSGLTGTFIVDNTTAAIYLNVIPEPSTYALLASGLVALAFLRRRKKSV